MLKAEGGKELMGTRASGVPMVTSPHPSRALGMEMLLTGAAHPSPQGWKREFLLPSVLSLLCLCP